MTGIKKGISYVWMRVTEDEYALPIVIADSSRELARKCGVKLNTIHHHISQHASGRVQGYPKYIRVVLEEEDEMEKLKHTKRQMARIPVMYEQLMRLHPDGMPSLGLVARWDRVGGGGGSGGSIVETVAMKNLSLTDTQREMLRWLDAVVAVYNGLNNDAGKNSTKKTHDRILAIVLKGRVFEGMSFEKIRENSFRPQISLQYIQKLYDQCVARVAQEAEKRGLLDGIEDA